jgi:uncharacterized membrane protein
MSQFFRYLVRGVLVTAPVGATLYIVYWIVRGVDDLVGASVPGLGVVLAVAVLDSIGFLASNVLGAQVVRLTDAILKRLPLIRILYNALKDLVNAFVGEQKNFDKPVAVQLPGQPFIFLGFQTRAEVPLPALAGYTAVYLPQSYNFAGNLVLVPESSVTPLDAPSAELMTFIVSGGVSGQVGPKPAKP